MQVIHLYSLSQCCDYIFFTLRHLVWRVRVTAQLSKRSWRTCGRPRRSWKNSGRKERKRADAVGGCRSRVTPSADQSWIKSFLDFHPCSEKKNNKNFSVFLILWCSFQEITVVNTVGFYHLARCEEFSTIFYLCSFSSGVFFFLCSPETFIVWMN